MMGGGYKICNMQNIEIAKRYWVCQMQTKINKIKMVRDVG